jgi:broad specificity phosphatase PhoE
VETTILLARHGETDWNREGRFQGRADPPLNDTGRAQAEELAAQVAGGGVSVVYASDLRRARDTATVVATRLGLELRLREDLREIDVGEFQGLTHAEIRERWPDVDRRVAEHGVGWVEGESLEEMRARVVGALAAIAREHPGEVVLVVGHGATIRALLATADGLDIVTHRQVIGPARNGSVVRLGVLDGRIRRAH